MIVGGNPEFLASVSGGTCAATCEETAHTPWMRPPTMYAPSYCRSLADNLSLISPNPIDGGGLV